MHIAQWLLALPCKQRFTITLIHPQWPRVASTHATCAPSRSAHREPRSQDKHFSRLETRNDRPRGHVSKYRRERTVVVIGTCSTLLRAHLVRVSFQPFVSCPASSRTPRAPPRRRFRAPPRLRAAHIIKTRPRRVRSEKPVAASTEFRHHAVQHTPHAPYPLFWTVSQTLFSAAAVALLRNARSRNKTFWTLLRGATEA